ncbi:COX15/CtaA family protein [Akkermansiaceae bacterium]|nr:COX15/CtaA family protein [Akkermansiaceae bacterium]MDB4660982.1 COX15/CtaA family protein [bacterium]MDA7517130.1 COX15/CtaA family protein [Akkermansiaceae bacterium]MDA7530971.1 COX15/CtaA family protein [Akkermansiaceae bacterium]MDA7532482.1 COX15/CtaA family protein [Akkermansiaceae bacterium]
MRKTGVQKLALLSIVLLIVLIFAGAVVRVTGSGLGCPDWPTCWGEFIPPTSIEQVDEAYLEKKLPRFKKSAERFGRNPDEITVERLLEEYDPVQTWIEFTNRLLALPLLLANFLLMIACLRSQIMPKLGVSAFALVIISALTGIVVVASGLRSGVVTIHMALAFLQLFVLTYLYWAGVRPGSLRTQITGPSRPQVMILLSCVMIEWAMGSQIREVTDRLMMEQGIASRGTWIDEISESFIYLIHRSFSWSILIAALWLGYKSRWKGKIPRLVLGLVFALMLMGLILSSSGIHAVVQVLHVGVAGGLVAAVYYWWLGSKTPDGGGSGG